MSANDEPFDLKTKKGLKVACEYVQGRMEEDMDEEGPRPASSIARVLREVATVPENRRASTDFQKQLWKIHSRIFGWSHNKSEIPDSLLESPVFCQHIAEKWSRIDNSQGLREDELNDFYARVAEKITSTYKPEYQIWCVRTILFPRDFTAVVRGKDLRIFGKEMEIKVEGRKNSYVVRSRKILERFKDALGPVNQEDFNVLAERMRLPWMVYTEQQRRRKQKRHRRSPPPPPILSRLAEELLFEVGQLQRIVDLLEDKSQIIFQGPPGTGKTYVARKIARYLAGSQGTVRIVQFHPSYAYEDFIQGYRPVQSKDGQIGFRLKKGPLLEAAKDADERRDSKHYLLIDEINRGNLAKIFGELYFLLEYRDESIRLQYSDEEMKLPKNLYIIGTMNTADRSIALVDLALRRRFNFVEFHPAKPPVQGLLARWLWQNAPDFKWIAKVVDLANKKLDGNGGKNPAAIGPSYFMRENLDQATMERIWEHSVLPYIEEHLYGQHERLSEFELETLRDEIQQPGRETGDADDEGIAEQSDAHDQADNDDSDEGYEPDSDATH